MILDRLPFYLGNIVACFVHNSDKRARLRGWVNVQLYRFRIAMFIRRIYGERVHKIRFIRQRTLYRMVCLVNDKYYVKVFRNLSVKQLQNFAFLVDYIRPHISVVVPKVVVNNHIAMYACERVSGRHINEFSLKEILANEKKIFNQVSQIISELQSIDVSKIPSPERFATSMQKHRSAPECDKPRQVLTHFDINETNLLFDDNMNVCALIDWDTVSIANNPNADWMSFLKYWNRYMQYRKNKNSVFS